VTPPGSPQPSVATLHADLTRSSANAPTSSLVDGMYAFGQDLIGHTSASSQNTVVSPLSIALAFSMARAGAHGATAAELDRIFHFPAGMRDEAFNTLTRGLITTDGTPPRTTATPSPGTPPPPPIVAIANSLWLDQGFHVRQPFLNTLAEQYGAGVRSVDFSSPSALVAINEWVQEQTADRIKKLFDQLDPATKLVLANAIYLKASWIFQFDPKLTRDAAFTRRDGSVIHVSTMHEDEVLSYAEGPGWQAVELPYASSHLAMWVLVPTGHTDPAALLDPATLQAAVAQHHAEDVELALPKWDFSTTLDLGEVLAQMGVHEAFSPAADFSGISPDLYISQAVHRANITVDENGTEAAAVTGLAMALGAMRTTRTVHVHADHPFAFAIVDSRSRAPLFLGTVTDPKAEGS